MNERPTHLDLFSGIGGFSLAFESAGFETIGFSEVDPYASAVLKKHWPNVPNFGDVREIPATLRRLADSGIVLRVDAVTGGFPCQPFSVAGKRRGKADDRHLWPAMFQVIKSVRPAWVCGENVPGIIGLALESVLSDLETAGYQCATFIVPACAVGAPHIRDRIWIIAHCSGERLQPGRNEVGGIQINAEALDGRQDVHTSRERCGEAREFRRDESAERIVSGGEAGTSERRRTQPGMASGTSQANPKTVSDANKIERNGSGRIWQGRSESSDRREALADAASEQTDRHDARGFQQEPARNGEAISDGNCVRGRSRDSERQDAIHADSRGEIVRPRIDREGWSTDAGILRVANGIPNRVQRIKCLGNSIVPQVPEIFAQAIYKEITK